MAILSKHYQAVTCIRFVQDGSFFMTAGDDNLLLVWKFAKYVHPFFVKNCYKSLDINTCRGRGHFYVFTLLCL